MKKKLFLGAYVNYTNAQNINCLSIAKHIDKKKFTVRILALSNIKTQKIKDVQIVKVSNNKFSIFFAFLFNLIWADVAYLPKHQGTPVLALKLAKIFSNVQLFTTIEGNMCDQSRRNMIDSFGSIGRMKKYFSLFPNIFGITLHIIQNANCGVSIFKSPLYLGVERDVFKDTVVRSKLNNIVFIGSLKKTKGIKEFLEISALFPELFFHIIGDGPYFNEIEMKKNIILHGKLDHIQISQLLKSMDLHFLPSKSEGFPKVILETACASIPSLVYSDYGAAEWISNNDNGFIINSKKDLICKIKKISTNRKLLEKNSKGAYLLSKDFDWVTRINAWESVIEDLI